MFSIAPTESFWMKRSLSDGFIVAIGMVLLFWVVLDLSAEASFRRSLKRVFLIVGTTLSFVAVLQAVGLNLTGIKSPDAGVMATFEHPTFFASMLVWTIFLSMVAGAEEVAESGGKGNKNRSALFIFLIGLQIIALILTLTRGAWVAVGVGLLLLWISWGSEQRFRGRWLIISFASVAAVAVALLAVPSVGQTLRSVVEWETGTGRLRVLWWSHSLDAISDRPWLGYGYHTSVVPLMQRTDPEEAWWANVDTDTVLAHNTVLDEALATGGLGAGTLIALILAVAIYALRHKPVASTRLMLVAVAAHLINGLFIFPTVVDRMMLWLVLAMLISQQQPLDLRVAPWKFRSTKPFLFLKRALALSLFGFVLLFTIDQANLAHRFRVVEQEIHSNNASAEFALERLTQDMNGWGFGAHQVNLKLSLLTTLLHLNDDSHRSDRRMSELGVLNLAKETLTSAHALFPFHPHLRLMELRIAGLDRLVEPKQRMQLAEQMQKDYSGWALVDETLGKAFEDASDEELAFQVYTHALEKYADPPEQQQSQMLSSVYLALLKKRQSILKAMGRIAVAQGQRNDADRILIELKRIDEKITALTSSDQATPWHK